MTLFNDAEAIYIGGQSVLRVCLGGSEVWAPPGVEVPGTFGDTGSGGSGNWPTSGDRGLLFPMTLAQDSTFVDFVMHLRAASNGGARYKGLLYAADAGGGDPGTLMIATPQSSVSVAGAQDLTMSAGSVSVNAGDYWIGYISNGGGGGDETDSGGTNAALTRMYNGVGGHTFASPGNPIPTWPGSPGPYSNVPSCYFNILYVP